MNDKCFLLSGDKRTEVEFIGIFDVSRVIEPSPFIGGHNGGVISGPIAVIVVPHSLENCKVFKKVELEELVFEENMRFPTIPGKEFLKRLEVLNGMELL